MISAIEERLNDATARGLAAAVTVAIRDGVIAPGTRLPPIRNLARELTLSPTTVSACWRQLTVSGVVRADGRRGTIVLDRSTPAPSRYASAMHGQSELPLDLSTGIPDGRLLPSLDGLPQTTPLVPQGYLSPSVLPALGDIALADWPCPAEEIAVVDGAMDGIDLVVRTHVSYGDRVAIEHPSYTPIVDLLESVGAEIIPLAMDHEGVLPAELRAALQTPLTAIILQPRGQNPTGVTMTGERAQALAALIEPTGTLVIEDDSCGAIATSPPLSLGRWLDGRVVHVRSYSKSHGPDLRVAVMSGPADVINQVEARRRLGQGWTSRLLQQLLVGLLTDTEAIATVDRARQTYAARRRALVEELARHDIVVGGTDSLNLWVPVADEPAALVRLARAGIGVAPGSAFILKPGYPHHIRVSAGLVPLERAAEVAEALAQASNTGRRVRR